MAKTVGELKKLLAGLDDSIRIVREGSDHDYEPARALLCEASLVTSGEWKGTMYEYFGPEYKIEGPSEIVEVLKVS